jgi:hypothetical protein
MPHSAFRYRDGGRSNTTSHGEGGRPTTSSRNVRPCRAQGCYAEDSGAWLATVFVGAAAVLYLLWAGGVRSMRLFVGNPLGSATAR